GFGTGQGGALEFIPANPKKWDPSATQGVNPFFRVVHGSMKQVADPGQLRLDLSTGKPVWDKQGDPQVRMERQTIDPENQRQKQDEWRRFWMNDQPDGLTPL